MAKSRAQLPARPATSPLMVAFDAKRIRPELRRYADEFLKIYEAAGLDPGACPSSADPQASAEHQPFGSDEWGENPRTDAPELGGYTIAPMVAIGRDLPQISHAITAALCGPTAEASVDRSRDPFALWPAERRVEALQGLRLIEYRTGHLYRTLVEAAVRERTMTQIGESVGANSVAASQVGLHLTVAALRLAKGAIDDLHRWQFGSGAPGIARALAGASGLPHWMHEAANDDMRKTPRASRP